MHYPYTVEVLRLYKYLTAPKFPHNYYQMPALNSLLGPAKPVNWTRPFLCEQLYYSDINPLHQKVVWLYKTIQVHSYHIAQNIGRRKFWRILT